MYAAKASLAQLRGLGDTLVWRVLRYGRGLITALGQGRRVDRLPSGRGLTAELAELERQRKRGEFAVLSGLTNCVSYGDVLAVDGWEQPGVRVVEVKASGRQPPRRQLERLARVQAVIDGTVETQDPQGPARPVDCPISLDAHHGTLERLLDQARNETYSWAEPEPGMLITAVDESDPARIGPSLDEHRSQTIAAVGWGTVAGTSMSEWSGSSINRLLRDRHYSFPGEAPLTLLPLEAATVVDLLTGPLLFYTNINPAELVGRFNAHGIDVELPGTKLEGESEFMTLTRGDRRVDLPVPARDQLLIELLTIESFVNIGVWLLDERGPSVGKTLGLNFAGETALWEAAPGVVCSR